MSDFKVWIKQDLWSNTIGILFTKEEGNKRLVAKPVELNFVEVNPDDEVRPTIRITHFVAPQFLKALAEALDKSEIKTEKDAKIQGILEATKKHLEDMRRLVFKKK